METVQAIGIAASVAAGVVIAIIMAKLKQHSEDASIDKEKILEECFGDHMYAEKFSLGQARDWIKLHQDKLNSGAKALVMKITPDSLRKLNISANISEDMENYLTIAIVDSVKNQMEDSILIKYDELDEKLENLLAKGDGTLVVGG
jgi:hypothetical protein